MLEIVIGGAIQGAIYALIAIGLNLQYGITKILNVAYGQFLVLGAFITSVFFRLYGINPLVSLAISACANFIAGCLIYIIIFRKIVRESKVPEELEARSLLACFGLLFVLQNMMLIIINNYVKIPITTTDFLRISISILWVKTELNKIVAMIVAIILSITLYIILRSTKAGMALRATAQEPTGAQLVGINISKFHLISFGLSALTGAVAGSLLSMIYWNFSPAHGGPLTFIALTVIVLGGTGSFIGSLVGGFILGYIDYIVSTMTPLLVMPTIYIFLIVMLLLRPKGLFGR